MWTDVIDLREFYAGRMGQVARHMLRRRIRAMWPDVRGLRVLGLGFATPFLGPFREEAERVLAIMPASQGVLRWPSEGPGLVALAEETELPLPDRSIDRVLMVHALESTEHVRALMREAWRVLEDGGRLMVVVPNRRGIWARLERTPFGNGRPYSPGQLGRMLRDNLFVPTQSAGALFVPPVRSRMLLRSAPAWEALGSRWFPPFGGVLLMEATKQIYAGTPLKEVRARRRYAVVPQGLAPLRRGRGEREAAALRRHDPEQTAP